MYMNGLCECETTGPLLCHASVATASNRYVKQVLLRSYSNPVDYTGSIYRAQHKIVTVLAIIYHIFGV